MKQNIILKKAITQTLRDSLPGQFIKLFTTPPE